MMQPYKATSLLDNNKTLGEQADPPALTRNTSRGKQAVSISSNRTMVDDSIAKAFAEMIDEVPGLNLGTFLLTFTVLTVGVSAGIPLGLYLWLT